MSEPAGAPVRPRVHSPFSKEVLRLEDLVSDLLAEERYGVLQVTGAPGWGKRTALDHLRAVLGERERLDVHGPVGPGDLLDSGEQVVVVTSTADRHGRRLGVVPAPLADWGLDEILEYLTACHPEHREDVFGRIRTGIDRTLLGGCPQLWALVLDAMAADPALGGPDDALSAHARALDVSPQQAGALARCLMRDVSGRRSRSPEDEAVERRVLETHPTLQQRPTRRLWLADHLAGRLGAGDVSLLTGAGGGPDDPEFLRGVSRLAADDGATRKTLRSALEGEDPWLASWAGSLLHVDDPSWLRDHLDAKAPDTRGLHLPSAWLPGLDAEDMSLAGIRLPQANLVSAHLRGANLVEADLAGADLSGADLRGADLERMGAEGACFREANLARAHAGCASFPRADFTGAVLDEAVLDEAHLLRADLGQCRAWGASFRGARLTGSKIEGADFSQADFWYVLFEEMDFRSVTLKGASFRRARLRKAHLEGVELPGTDFESAWLLQARLTGAVLPCANLRDAQLTGAEMAYVNLEGADLRGACLRHVSFHLGSSRSGLVFSPYASEGSRTGFYTDDDQDAEVKSVEEIRKANLRGADLRGAHVEEADFYLVDLREARYDARQAIHFRHCRAILE